MPEKPVSALDPRLQKQVENARLALSRDNAEYALNLCLAILDKEPGCVPVRRMLHEAQRRFRKSAGKSMVRELRSLGRVPKLLMAAGTLKNDPAAGLRNAERALCDNPENRRALLVAAKAAIGLDFLETALLFLEPLRRLSPRNRTAARLLGQVYLDAGQPGKAVNLSDELLALNPADGVAQELARRASVAQSIATGNWESDSGTFRDKLRDEEQSVNLEDGARRAVSPEAMKQQASDLESRIAAGEGTEKLCRRLSELYRRLGDVETALHWLAEARRFSDGSNADIDADEARLREELLRVRLGAPDLDDSERKRLAEELGRSRLEEAERLVTMYPNDLGNRYRYGRLLRELGRIDEAIRELQSSRQSPKWRAASAAELGACFRAKGLLDLAIGQYESAVADGSVSGEQLKEIRYRLAGCYEAHGEPQKALDHYKQIYAIDISYRDVASKIEGSGDRE